MTWISGSCGVGDPTPDEQSFTQLTLDFPRWHVWRTKAPGGTPASWAATPQGAGTLATVFADTAQNLRAQLAELAERAEWEQFLQERGL